MSEYHNPVMLEESIQNLIGNQSGLYVDATFGGGGHTAGILSRLSSEGKVIAFDRDSDAILNKPDDSRLTLIHNNFRFIENFVKAEGFGMADGVLADLGVSSHQFDTASRGFSFRFDAPLDMRMNQEGGKTAADIVNGCSEEEIGKILAVYGEIPNPRKAAKLIVAARPINTTTELNAALSPILPGHAEHKFLAKVYQALRIVVNQEMRSLEKFLDGAARILKPGGRLVVITYQSLEDRMVKNFIRTGNIEGKEVKDFYGNLIAPLRAVNRKPIEPSEEEIAANTRARSAKLRVAEKVRGESADKTTESTTRNITEKE